MPIELIRQPVASSDTLMSENQLSKLSDVVVALAKLFATVSFAPDTDMITPVWPDE